jgi:dephospho-CoA kinase
MNTSSSPRIVGLAGTFASGKDTLAHYLVTEYNYLHVSTGDMVRQEALKERGSIERPVLHEVATKLRKTHGAGVLVDLAVKMFQAKCKERDDYAGLVVSGLRSLGEAKAIKAAGGTLVFTDAPLEIRYQRMVSRQRDDETRLTLDEFKAQEATELATASNDDESFNILGIRGMADIQLINDTGLQGYLDQAIKALHLDKAA